MIEGLNSDPTVHGVIVQLPLPPHMSESRFEPCIPLDDCNLTNRVCNSVLPNKDVDGFTGASLGRLVQVHGHVLPYLTSFLISPDTRAKTVLYLVLPWLCGK